MMMGVTGIEMERAMDTRLPTGGVCPEVGHDCTRPRHMGPRHADKASDIEGWISDIHMPATTPARGASGIVPSRDICPSLSRSRYRDRHTGK